ncbi:MAG: mechanosensitive ion channel [Candidatus Krumholzibacteriota bacterium]|nr:mechanosensitive ion channel [Candidatus Krumholzibacteriota bacterium]
MQDMYTFLVDFARAYGLKIIGAIVILIIGRIAAGLIKRAAVKILKKSKTDPAIISFVGSLVYTLIIVFTVIAALSKFGVETASFVAILGAAGFAIGFALQGSLASFASGVLLLVFRPIKIGDFVEIAGVAGTVKEIRLFNTVIATPDNVKIYVPNGKINGDIIKNYAGFDTRRIDLVFGIAYGSPIDKAHQILQKIASGDQRVLVDPACQIAVAELSDSSVNFVLRPWVKKEDYWAVRFDITEKVKKEFDSNGIEIPFPQTDVHLYKETAAN